MLLQTIREWALVLATIMSAFGAASGILFLRQRKNLAEAKIGMDRATETKLANEAAKINSDLFLERERSLREDISDLRTQLREARLLSDERFRRLDRVERYINRHQPWDWKAVNALRKANIPIEDPPTLMYLDDPDPVTPPAEPP